jgi:hypothetical protein
VLIVANYNAIERLDLPHFPELGLTKDTLTVVNAVFKGGLPSKRKQASRRQDQRERKTNAFGVQALERSKRTKIALTK